MRLVRRAAVQVQPRRVHVYNVGCPKTGTTTVSRMFPVYRAAHECNPEGMLPFATAVLNGELASDAPKVRRALRYRSVRFHLEVDAASFLTPFTSTLVELYPKARFVLTIR